jgi:hypothetical protein
LLNDDLTDGGLIGRSPLRHANPRSCSAGPPRLGGGCGQCAVASGADEHRLICPRLSGPAPSSCGNRPVRRAISSFAPIRKHVERLNVSGTKISAIERGVRYERFDQASACASTGARM